MALTLSTALCADFCSHLVTFACLCVRLTFSWINDENPLAKAHAYAEAHDFQTPIDEIDAAARVLDPIFVGYNSDETVFGKFLKDFHETEW